LRIARQVLTAISPRFSSKTVPRCDINSRMLLTRAEMTFEFNGARLHPERDAEMLAWMMNQFLYGEVTGIQCGHWLYDAPDLDAARFFSRQAVEEFQHVDNFVRILELLGHKPAKAHGMVRFLTSGMMPNSFEEHVCLEMAQGEGFVLLALYAIIDTIDTGTAAGAEIRQILIRAVKQEERHVAFGERRTQAALIKKPSLKSRLLGLSLVSIWGVKKLGGFMRDRLPREHEVLKRLPEFLAFTQRCAETRLLRMGVLVKPLSETSALTKLGSLASAYALKPLIGLITLPLKLLPAALDPTAPKRVTDTYLDDKDLDARVRSAKALSAPREAFDELESEPSHSAT
jgi:hypothetical protein